MRVIHGINFFCVGIKAAVLLTEALPCMHWHAARVARSFQVVLVLINLMTLTTVTRYVCICCEQRGTLAFTTSESQVPFPRSSPQGITLANLVSAELPAWAYKKLRWEQGRPTPWWAAPAQQAQRQTCGTNRRVGPIFVNKM